MIFHAMEDWLCVKTDDNPVLVVEPPFAKRSRREKFEFELFPTLGLRSCCLKSLRFQD